MTKQPWHYLHHGRQMLAYRVKCRTREGKAADLLTQAQEERARGNLALARSCVEEAAAWRKG